MQTERQSFIHAYRNLIRCGSLLTATFFCGAVNAAHPALTRAFDTDPVGPIAAGQEWTLSGTPAVTPMPGRGNVLALPPASSAALALPDTSKWESYRISYSDGVSRTPAPRDDDKLTCTALDSAGRELFAIERSATGRWIAHCLGGQRWFRAKLPDVSWGDVQVDVNQSDQTFTVRLILDGKTSLLFDSLPFKIPAAAVSRLSFQHTAPPISASWSVDNITVTNAVVATNERVDAWVEDAPRVNAVPYGHTIKLHVHAKRDANAPADLLDWTVRDYREIVHRQGTLALPAGAAEWDGTIDIGSSLPAGYYALSGKTRHSGVTFARRGTQPRDMVAFGVITPIKAVPLAHIDDSRFGMQGTTFTVTGVAMSGDPYQPLYGILGARWVNYPGGWDRLEPERFGQYDPTRSYAPAGEAAFGAKSQMPYLTCIDGIPKWASAIPTKMRTAATYEDMYPQAYPPKDPAQYEDFLRRIASHQDKMRRDHYPNMAYNWYQTAWEPDWHWRGSPQEFVTMSEQAYRAVHAGDPNAIVLGPGTGVLTKTIEWLRTMLPMGMDKCIDGIATHGYYLGQGDPNDPTPGQLAPPEDKGLIAGFREVKSLARKYLKPGAKIVQSEWGLDWDQRATVDMSFLRKVAAYVIRGNILMLGEGVDTTFFFYSSDIGTTGMGWTYNLSYPERGCGATSISPKIELVAGAAMTRMLEGTKTIGPLSKLPADVYAYAFNRGGKTVVALWKGHGGSTKVALPTKSGATLVDFMGNASTLRDANGNVTVLATDDPVYVEGVDASRLTLVKLQ
ncbi:MAG TPA: hypothetical protein VGK19_23545 [Capsulimonadaceae bacterium]|jgi:hypothetical protein